MRSLVVLLPTLLLPAVAAAVPSGPPLDLPVSPVTPPGPVEIDAPPVDRPPVAAPPLELTLPDPPQGPGALPEVVPADAPGGPPDSLPLGEGIPDLTGEVILPAGADLVFEVAPPFGGTPGRHMAPVPEPGTALLLASGLVALGARRSRRS